MASSRAFRADNRGRFGLRARRINPSSDLGYRPDGEPAEAVRIMQQQAGDARKSTPQLKER